MSIRLVDGRPMQCKHIPDDVFLEAVRRTPGTGGSNNWRMRWEVQAALEAQLGHIPERLFLAKARQLHDARKLGGCMCGCRGDYHLTEECHDGYCCRPMPSKAST
ncbi:hypothetical protein AB0M87_04500 [Streptomyces sp. NPDC051320]|uniref:hypothetical protein n=1 Tax=Streptomyces sp. NPDC051320 TaxID=3154644 RepID=UPI0034410A00